MLQAPGTKHHTKRKPTDDRSQNDSTATSDREIVITRVLDAPRALVFSMWTDPTHIAHWWGPRGFTNTIGEMDVRRGGVWRYVMHGPDGVDYRNKVVYIEIVEPERIVYWHSDDEEEGDPGKFHVTATFTEEAGKTTVTMRMIVDSAAELQKMKEFGVLEGGNQTLERLAEYVAKM